MTVLLWFLAGVVLAVLWLVSLIVVMSKASDHGEAKERERIREVERVRGVPVEDSVTCTCSQPRPTGVGFPHQPLCPVWIDVRREKTQDLTRSIKRHVKL